MLLVPGGLSIRSFKEKKISWRVREAHAEQLRAAKASLPAAQPKVPEFAFPSFLSLKLWFFAAARVIYAAASHGCKYVFDL